MEKKIDKNNVEDLYELSDTQKGMLFFYVTDNSNHLYYEQLSIRLNGIFIYELFNKALNIVIENNQALRTVFAWKELKQPVQIVLKKNETIVKYEDLSMLPIEQMNNVLSKDKLDEYEKNIDITKVVIRCKVYKITDSEYEVLVMYHHISFDGWSCSIFINELMMAYNDLYNKTTIRNTNKESLKHYFIELKKHDNEKAKLYWENTLKNYKNNYDYFDTEDTKKLIKQHHVEVDNNLFNNIQVIAKIMKVTVASIFYAVWSIILQKFNNDDVVAFGTVVSGRNINVEKIDNMMGLFIHTVPLKIDMNQNTTLIELIQKINIVMKQRNDYENLSLSEIRELCKSLESKDIFNTIIAIENYPIMLKDKDNILDIEKYSMREASNYNLYISLITSPKASLDFYYNTHCLSEMMVARIGQYIINILDEIVCDYNKKVIDIVFLSNQDKTIIQKSNRTNLLSKNQTIIDMFEKQVDDYPNQIAVVFQREKITYKQLNDKVNKVANYLMMNGVKTNVSIGVYMSRTIDLIAVLLGILKAGCAYLPIDTSIPNNRILHMISDSNTKLLICNKELFNQIDCPIKKVDIQDIYIQNVCCNLSVDNKPEDLAYIIYTSGTTGLPKGVMVEQKQVTNFIEGIIEETDICNYKSMLCITSSSFDIFVMETLLPLTNHITVVLTDEQEQIDGDILSQYILDNMVQCIQLTPSRLKLLLMSKKFKDVLKTIRSLFVGGEALTKSLVDQIRDCSDTKIYNMYGPTETTVWSTFKIITDSDDINIGLPIRNTQVYIMDRYNHMQPIGVPGELFIAGDGVSRGYMNNTKLTNEKFIVYNKKCGTRMYKTGDLARWLNNGEIEYIGRRDKQVKIHGYRIEISEIENVLQKYSLIQECAVVKKNVNNSVELCAYIVSKDKINTIDIKNYLRRFLPNYMVPPYIVNMDKLPINVNGKLDVNELPDPSTKGEEVEVQEIEMELETEVKSIWEKVLGISLSNSKDHFFDLGGDSIKAMTLISYVNSKYVIHMSISEVMKNITLKEMCEQITTRQKYALSNIKKAPIQPNYELSSMQNRIYYIYKANKESINYNMPILMEIEGHIDRVKLENAFRKLILRHEILRTSFEYIDEHPVQIVHTEFEFNLPLLKTVEDSIEGLKRRYVTPFKLNEYPLLRAAILDSNSSKQYLFIDMHHIISDALSVEIISEEIELLYSETKIEPLTIQYKDYCVWEREYVKSDRVMSYKTYWKEKIKELSCSVFPNNFLKNEQSEGFEKNQYTFKSIEKDRIEKYCNHIGISKASYFIGILGIVMSKELNDTKITVGLPVTLRNVQEVQNVIGLFINIVLLKCNINNESLVNDYFTAVHNELSQTLNNSEYPYDKVYDMFLDKNQNEINSIFDVMLNYVSYKESRNQFNIGEAKLSYIEEMHVDSKAMMTLYITDYSDEIELIVISSNNLKTLIKDRFVESFIQLSKSMIDCRKKIGEIEYFDLLKDVENDQIIDDSLYEDTILFDM